VRVKKAESIRVDVVEQSPRSIDTVGDEQFEERNGSRDGNSTYPQKRQSPSDQGEPRLNE